MKASHVIMSRDNTFLDNQCSRALAIDGLKKNQVIISFLFLLSITIIASDTE